MTKRDVTIQRVISDYTREPLSKSAPTVADVVAAEEARLAKLQADLEAALARASADAQEELRRSNNRLKHRGVERDKNKRVDTSRVRKAEPMYRDHRHSAKAIALASEIDGDFTYE